VEKKDNWLVSTIIKSIIWGIGVGIGAYLFEFGIGIISDNLLINSIGMGCIVVPLSVIESFIVKKIKESRA